MNRALAWHEHVFEDLQPYLCTVSDYPTPAALFLSHRGWAQHLKDVHADRWTNSAIITAHTVTANPSISFAQCCICEHETDSKRQRIFRLAVSFCRNLLCLRYYAPDQSSGISGGDRGNGRRDDLVTPDADAFEEEELWRIYPQRATASSIVLVQ